ncbi:hypothetical protein [Priestia abyssalis]|uniref:hypothetical protein n=1 Tax=Priestia abyssalis TaxID=1221450 RepID=UPI0009950157|nr:hypothetical protein [Priestia abyssalis]
MFNYVIVILIVSAIIVYLLSFFKHSKIEALEKQVEQLSLSMMQETYQLKKQIKVLQEELMIDSFQSPLRESMPVRPIVLDNALPMHTQIIHFHKEGYSIQEIAKHTSLPLEEVRLIIQQQHWGGRS